MQDPIKSISNTNGSRNYTIYFILLYLLFLIVRPQSRFPVLGEIHIEKIIVLVSWIVLILSAKIVIRSPKMMFLIFAFYLAGIASYFLSPYKDFFQSQHWIENYWKLIILYLLILFTINDTKDIFTILLGFVLITFLYQACSWYDFLHGGSYVWQQGIKRIVGIWSGGLGAANYYGMITVLSLPFALFLFQIIEKKKSRLFLICYFIISFCSISYSGTRGAMASFIFFILINIRSMKHLKLVTLVLVLIAGISILALPDYLKDRYFDSIPFISKQQAEIEDRFHKISKGSAESRVKGLIDGWELVKLRPLFGHGPGSSPLARKKVREELRYSEYDYQMHNLYGQLLAETGFLGTILFFSIIITYFYKLSNMRSIEERFPKIYNYKLALQNSMFLMLFYGFASHTLYRYYWFLLFACHGAFLDILSKNLKQKADGTDLTASTSQSLETS